MSQCTEQIKQELNTIKLEMDCGDFDPASFRESILGRFPNAPEMELTMLVDMAGAYVNARAEMRKSGVIESYNDGHTKGMGAGLKAMLEINKAITRLLIEISKRSNEVEERNAQNANRLHAAFMKGFVEYAAVKGEIDSEISAGVDKSKPH